MFTKVELLSAGRPQHANLLIVVGVTLLSPLSQLVADRSDQHRPRNWDDPHPYPGLAARPVAGRADGASMRIDIYRVK